MLREEKGFTLVELLIVMVILAVLAIVAVPRFIDMREDARRSTCIATQASLETAIEQFLYYQTVDPTLTTPASDADWADWVSTQHTITLHDAAGEATEDKQDTGPLLKRRPVCPSTGTELVVTATGDVFTVSCNTTGH